MGRVVLLASAIFLASIAAPAVNGQELLVDQSKLSKMWVLRRILMQMGTIDAM